jgi:hypothetical protein
MTGRNLNQRRVLDPMHVVRTLQQLQARIEERFPTSGLAQVAADLAETGAKTAERARALARPYFGLQFLVALVAVTAAGVELYLASRIDWSTIGRKEDVVVLTQGLESAVNLSLLAAGAIWFLARLETRLKRARALRDLYQLRAFAHVIDMHQLTKDPSTIGKTGAATASSPTRAMSEFQLLRYLDYCSELLALTSKLAALYAARSTDPEDSDAVNDVETLTSNLGRKIWQKITILSQLREVEEAGGASVNG